MSGLFVPKPVNTFVEEGRVREIPVGTSSYGTALVSVFGSARVNGNVIWQSPVRESVTYTTESVGGGKGGGGSAEITTAHYKYHMDVAVLLSLGPIYGVRKIWQDGTQIFNLAEDATPAEVSTSNALLPRMTVYTGSMTQSADPTMQAVLGVANTPAYRGRAYMVLRDIDVTSNGARTPSLSIEVVQNGQLFGGNQIQRVPVSIASVLTSICVAAGLQPSQIDTTLVTSEIMGISVSSGEYDKAIQDIMTAFDIGMVESAGKLKFYPLSGMSTITVSASDLGARDRPADSPPEQLFSVTRQRDISMPGRMQVTYLDSTINYQQSAQTAKRQSGTNADYKVDLSIAMTPTEARRTAERLLYRKWLERDTYGFSLPPKYMRVEPGDIVQTPTFRFRLKSVTLGANGVIECSGMAHDDGLISQPVSGFGGTGAVTTMPASGGPTTMHLLNLPALIDTQDGAPVFHVAASGGANWNKGVLFESIDNGVSYSFVTTVPVYSRIGTTNNILPVGSPHVWDTTSTVSVTLLKGQLSSIPDAQVLAGGNRILIGDEIVQFATATLTGPNTYTLSRLLRGRKGTEWAISGHTTGERVIVLDGTPVPVVSQFSKVGGPILYKCVANGEDISSQSAITFSITAENLRPYSGVNAKGVRTPFAGGTAPVTWINAIGVTVAGNDLTKTASAGWGNAGASSAQSITSGAGNVTFTASETNTGRMLGLSNPDVTQGFDDIGWAFFLNEFGGLEVYEYGTARGGVGTYVPGDVLMVETTGSQVLYRKNGAVVYTSLQTPTYPLIVDTALREVGSTLNDAVITSPASGGDLAITWFRRGRIGQELPSGTDIPLSEASAIYEVDIMNGANVVRTITTTDTAAIYTAAMQVADFGSTQSSVLVNIYQRSASVGRGRVLTATL